LKKGLRKFKEATECKKKKILWSGEIATVNGKKFMEKGIEINNRYLSRR